MRKKDKLQSKCRSESNLRHSNSKETLDRSLLKCLLDNNQNLLAVICDGAIVGESAASLSAEVLSILRQQNRQITEEFVKRLLRKKIQKFVARESDLADVLRDNSMASMCLNSYARYEGLGFLSTCLKGPLQEIMNDLHNVELDPNRLSESRTANEGERLLKKSMEVIMQSILANQYHLPVSIRRLCKFINDSICEATGSPAPQYRQAETVPLNTISESPQISRTNSQVSTPPTKLRNAVSEDGSNDQTQKETQPDVSLVDNLASTEIKTSPPVSQTPSSKSEVSSSTTSKFSPLSSLSSPKELQQSVPPGTHPSIQLLQSQTSGAKLAASMSSNDLFLRRERAFQAAVSPVVQNVKFESRTRSSSVKIDERNRFSLPEKLIGSFLFLRFIIPALTAPDAYGIVEGKLTPQQRRGLLLCGKVMTGLSNDIDFGHKEEHLQSINPFLHANRDKVKAFIRFACTELPPLQSRPSDFLYENTTSSSSLGNTNGDNGLTRAPSTEKHISIRTSNTLQSLGILGNNRDRFFSFLIKNMHRIESAMQEELPRLSVSESEGVVQNFEELKRLLAKSPYDGSVESVNKLETKGLIFRLAWVKRLIRRGTSNEDNLKEGGS